MRNKKILLCVVFAFSLVTSCMVKSERRGTDDFDVILQKIIEDKNADKEFEIALNVNLDSLPFEDRNTFKGFVFLLNADCSFCVKQFLDFIIYLNEKNIHMPLIVVVEEGDTEAVTFYMEQIKIEFMNSLLIVENDNRKIISKSLELCSGVVLFCEKGNLVNSIILRY